MKTDFLLNMPKTIRISLRINQTINDHIYYKSALKLAGSLGVIEVSERSSIVLNISKMMS